MGNGGAITTGRSCMCTLTLPILGGKRGGGGMFLTALRSFCGYRCPRIHLNGPLVLGFHLNGPLGLGFHLNGPLVSESGKTLVMSVVSWSHPPLGPSSSGSPGSLSRLSARRTRTSNAPRTTHVTGGRRLTAYTRPHVEPTLATVRKRQARFPGYPSA